jgi:hypothetical protein
MKNKFLKGLVVSLALAASGFANAGLITSVEFDYTGDTQLFTVDNGVSSIFIESWGAQGWTGSNQGGLGGFTSGYLDVTAGETLWLYVGGQGTQSNGDRIPSGGGFNGGGDGTNNHTTTSTTCCVGGGGGATDIRQLFDSLDYRVLVAGGGGGSTNNAGAFGGAGGGLVGGDAGSNNNWTGGTGGSQTAGGSLNGAFGQGGNATTDLTPWIGGGGGGWYGGGTSSAHYGGGGGSSYIGGVSNGYMAQGVRSGNGFLRITYETTEVPEPSTIAIFALGLMGLASRKFKKQA